MIQMPNVARTALQALLFAAGGAFLAASSQAAPPAVDQAKSEAKRQYEADIDRCKTLSDNAEDVCKAEAKLRRITAVSSAEARSKGTPKAAHEARKDIADAQYELAKERCDDKTGNDKDVCRKEAKAARVAAISEADVQLKAGKAMNEAIEDRTDANYSAAKEKCDALSGDAKDACQARAKADHMK